MLFPSRHRFHPRSQQERDRDRREAALQAQISDLTLRIQVLEKEQQIQFKRIAELQRQLDQTLARAKSER